MHKKQCCGCTACYNVCPKSCITMVRDKEGFSYPKLDKDKCISCGACERMCPVNNRVRLHKTNMAFAVQNKNADILFHSALGGAFTAIATSIINRGEYLGQHTQPICQYITCQLKM